MARDTYGHFNPCLWGVRYWGKYAAPYEFNIAVNEMEDVKNHKDVPLVRGEAISIPSSLSGGCRINSRA